MTDPDHQERRGELGGGGGGGGEGGHPDSEIRGGRRPPWAPPLDLSLLTNEMDRIVRHLKRSWEQSLPLLP